LCVIVSPEIFEVLGPADPVVVLAGEDAVLPCYLSPNISAEDMEIRWFREISVTPVCLFQYAQYDFSHQMPSYKDRAELFPEELKKGNVSLRLKDVRGSDDGGYNCLVRSALMEEETHIKVLVKALGSQPSVSLHSEGGQTRLECRSEGWYPEPVVIWTDRDGHDVTSPWKTRSERDSWGFLTVSSFIPVRQESSVFTCLIRSAEPEPDWGYQLHISRDFFPDPSGWMVSLFLMAALTVAAAALLVIQWRRMGVSLLVSSHSLSQCCTQPVEAVCLFQYESHWSHWYHSVSVLSIIMLSLFTEALRFLLKSEKRHKGEEVCLQVCRRKWLPKDICRKCDELNVKHLNTRGDTSQAKGLSDPSVSSCFPTADVTLDPDTAYCELTLSEDGKRVRRGDRQDLPDNHQRFDYWLCVVSRESFTSGRHYWVLEVNGWWTIGVTRESANRRGGISFTPQQGYWCLYCDSSSLFALTDPLTRLPQTPCPRMLGVCVDIEERRVSFYTVESRAHIYTFTDMRFPEGDKIYPFF
ncbi:BT1A1 protein, partial [Amia calva]|nr:BT1A1 protein [Amia calva]